MVVAAVLMALPVDASRSGSSGAAGTPELLPPVTVLPAVPLAAEPVADVPPPAPAIAVVEVAAEPGLAPETAALPEAEELLEELPEIGTLLAGLPETAALSAEPTVEPVPPPLVRAVVVLTAVIPPLGKLASPPAGVR